MSTKTTRNPYRIARYTDGSEVREGDAIRYRQAPGGMLPASPDWTYGTAEKFPHTAKEREGIRAYNEKMNGETLLCTEELTLRRTERKGEPQERIAHYNIVGHIVERVEK